MLAALFLGLASGTHPPVPCGPPPSAGRLVLSASNAGAGQRAEGSLVLTLGSASGARDAARAVVSTAEDEDLARAIAAAPRIELHGGTWLGWYQSAHERRHERAWTRALRRAHASGRDIRAVGGAAAWVARWSAVPRAVLDKPAQDPHDGTLDLPVEGLGLLDGPLVGVLEADAPTADRVVEQAVLHGYPSVLLLAGDVALEWAPRERTARVRQGGEGFLLWIDLSAGTRSRERLRDVRFSFPRDGDTLDPRTGSLARDPRDRVTPEPAVQGPGTPDADLTVLARVAERLAGGEPGLAPPGLRNVRTSRDEKTERTAFGGLSRGRLDFELSPRSP